MKLVHHISFRYIGVAALVLLLSIPILYLVLQKVMVESFDEELVFQKNWIVKSLEKTPPESFTPYNRNIIIRPEKSFNPNNHFFTEDVYVSEDQETVPYRILEFSTVVHGQDYSVRVQKSLVETDDILQSIATLQFGVLFILLIAMLFINMQLKRKIWNPFYQTLNSLKNYQLSQNQPLQLPTNPITEINDFNSSVNILTRRNLEAYQAQKEFTENASHELQTPLAILQSNIDLLWQTQPLSEMQMKLIGEISEANFRISRLTKALLLLTKIDNQQFTNRKDVNLSKLITEVLEKTNANFFNKNIHINSMLKDDIRVFADETLMEILFMNLITNACRYSSEHSEVTIVLNDSQFFIENTSVDNQTLVVDRLFKRFQKQHYSHTNSIGLGLEICKKICDQSSFIIDYRFADGKHRFDVSW